MPRPRSFLAQSVLPSALLGFSAHLLALDPMQAAAVPGREPATTGNLPGTAPPSSEVLHAIRLLLSTSPEDESRGEQALRRMGRPIAPQLRHWIRRIRCEVERVRRVLDLLEVDGEPVSPLESLTAEELFERKLLECRSLARAGDHRRTLELAEAILVLDRDTPYAWELRRLERRSRERLASQEMLEPSLEIEKLVFEVGEPPKVMFRLTNRQPAGARILVEKGILGEVDVAVTQKVMAGSMGRERRKVRIQVPDDVREITLGPGKSWEREVVLDLGDSMPLAGSVARVQIGGKFRPSAWSVGALEGNIGITITESELWIVPPGESAGCDRPLEKLATALLFGNMEPFFVGGQLAVWAGEDDPYLNEKLIRTLLDGLDGIDEKRLMIAVRLLAEATGQDFGADTAKWKEWWARAKG